MNVFRNHANGDVWIMETSRDCFFTDVDELEPYLNVIYWDHKKICKQNGYSFKVITGKRYELLMHGLSAESWGTWPKAKENLKWYLDNGYVVERMYANALNQIRIYFRKLTSEELYELSVAKLKREHEEQIAATLRNDNQYRTIHDILYYAQCNADKDENGNDLMFGSKRWIEMFENSFSAIVEEACQ